MRYQYINTLRLARRRVIRTFPHDLPSRKFRRALRGTPHPRMNNFAEALAAIERLKKDRVVEDSGVALSTNDS
jgi:hypothetical protein